MIISINMSFVNLLPLIEEYQKRDIEINKKLRLLYKIIEYEVDTSSKLDIPSTLWEDLSFFTLNGVFCQLEQTKTYFGLIYLYKIFTNPLKRLPKFQNTIKKIISNPSISNKLNFYLDEILKIQNDIIWIFQERNESEKKLLSSVFFSHKYLKKLNKNRLSIFIHYFYKLIVQPCYTIFSPLLCFILPYVILKYKMNINIPINVYLGLLKKVVPASFGFIGKFQISKKNMLWVYVSTIFSSILYIQSIYNQINQSFQLREISNGLKKKINSIIYFINTLNKINTIFNCNKKIVEIPWYLKDIKESDSNASYLWRYQILIDNKEDLIPIINSVGYIDAIQSISNFYITSKNNNLPVCFPEVVTNKESSLAIYNFYHPLINFGKIVLNSLEIGF